MKKKKQDSKQLSGGAKLKAAGKRAVLLGMLPDDYEQIKKASLVSGRSVANFITFHAIIAAQELIDGKSNHTGFYRIRGRTSEPQSKGEE